MRVPVDYSASHCQSNLTKDEIDVPPSHRASGSEAAPARAPRRCTSKASHLVMGGPGECACAGDAGCKRGKTI